MNLEVVFHCFSIFLNVFQLFFMLLECFRSLRAIERRCGAGRPQRSREVSRWHPRRRRPSVTSCFSEALPKVQQAIEMHRKAVAVEDPVLTVMMNGPPLFSPALCTRAPR